MIGYKCFYSDMTGKNNFQYKLGETYKMPENEIELAKSGFHFCVIPGDALTWRTFDSKFAIIEANGKILHDENISVCSEITIKRMITEDEIRHMSNGKFIGGDGTIKYYRNGNLHRDDGPAILGKNVSHWFKACNYIRSESNYCNELYMSGNYGIDMKALARIDIKKSKSDKLDLVSKQ